MKKRSYLSNGIVNVLISAAVILLNFLPWVIAIVIFGLLEIDKRPPSFDILPEFRAFLGGIISFSTGAISFPFAFASVVISLIVLILFIVTLIVGKRNPDKVFGFALAQAICMLINMIIFIFEWILNGIIYIGVLTVFGWIAYQAYNNLEIKLLSAFGWPFGIAGVAYLLLLLVSIVLAIPCVIQIYKISCEHKSMQPKKTIS